MLEDENRNNNCCEKQCVPNIPTYSYNFTNVSAEEDTCEEIQANRSEMLNQIRCLSFAIVELAQYLDTHPDSKKAIQLHKEYANKYHDLANKYQSIYGPLSIYFPCNKWRWLEEPWPSFALEEI